MSKKLEPCPPTNADRIRAMTDIELANFIAGVATNDFDFRSLFGGYSSALKWLTQPAKEEG